ncbi:hypothetical protein SAMN04488540_12628 [Ferrimonas sediminum]|uniref:MEMO1 family protein SAMN04488540_12628 n=1 Tax=Ferrimonas sediminum TaxID=718193 RepID=A0A1G9B1G7_9GAMM|nr:AmmeMemoRadiSam system protein B [Ferrimonas sediminum]SDK33288.1 hypothetical protein SAMN04488540_12628 [Ferrimonas sediminum]
MSVRSTAVAGSFYPDDPAVLAEQLDQLVTPGHALGMPKAVIVPHAGYVYSGEVAGRLFGSLDAIAGHVSRVVMLGPSHRVSFEGIALPGVEGFDTPFGVVEIDTAACQRLLDIDGIEVRDDVHQQEHSLEVQLPFIKRCFTKARIVPLLVGGASATLVAKAMKRLWGGDETLMVISSDLSHFMEYAEAKDKDRRTCHRIETLDGPLHGDDACGCRAINGLMLLAKERGMQVRCMEYLNSGDTAGDKQRVVGYASFAVYEG